MSGEIKLGFNPLQILFYVRRIGVFTEISFSLPDVYCTIIVCYTVLKKEIIDISPKVSKQFIKLSICLNGFREWAFFIVIKPPNTFQSQIPAIPYQGVAALSLVHTVYMFRENYSTADRICSMNEIFSKTLVIR